jgi:L-ribulose-5-phosphate 3-epimerase
MADLPFHVCKKDNTVMTLSRRNFILKSSLIAAGLSVGVHSVLKAEADTDVTVANSLWPSHAEKEPIRYSVFSKHLHAFDYTELATLVAEAGFDGIDLTVRPKGHVLPENVETDLPKAVAAAKKAGISIFMIVTSINDADDPLTERILKTASLLGITHYRMDWLYYDENISIEENLFAIQAKMSKLAALNEKYKIRGEYQNHSGKYTPNSYFGSAIWDLYFQLNNINSPWLGSQYDIMHAHVEGAYSWETGLKLINPFISSLAVKDFHWTKKQDKWTTEVVPVGEGMIDFNYYFQLLKRYKISCPVTMHYEYPMGNLEKTDYIPTSADKAEVVALMKKDLDIIKSLMKQNGLI